MVVTAGIGPATTLLELTASSIGYGIVAGTLVVSAAGMFLGWSRKELEADALRNGFWAGLSGILCLCIDLLLRYPG
jgi:hypothetical protein